MFEDGKVESERYTAVGKSRSRGGVWEVSANLTMIFRLVEGTCTEMTTVRRGR
jgi:hypothetical protein